MQFDETTLRQAFAAMPKQAVFLVDGGLVHRLCAGDPQTLADLGFDPDTIEGHPVGYTQEGEQAESPWAANIAAIRRCIDHGMTDESLPIVAWHGRFYESVVAPIRDILHDVVGAVLTVRDVSHRERNKQQLEFLARVDRLTKLPNRSALLLHLRKVVLKPHPAAIVMIDLDGFKLLNDSGGHAAGDACLHDVARALERSVRAGDVAARRGGDEFALVLANVPSVDGLTAVLDRVRAAIAALPYGVTASVGYAIYPDDGTDPDALLAHADAAMYAQKKARGASLRP